MTEKPCSKCGLPKPLSEFYADKYTKDGKCSNCKACHKVYNAKNKEKIAVYNKKYRAENKDEIAAKGKVYYAENKEKIAAYNAENKEKKSAYYKDWYIKNRDERIAYYKVYYAENMEEFANYKAKNKDKIIAQSKKYYFANKDKIAAYGKSYQVKNWNKIAARKKTYNIANRDKSRAKSHRRRARKEFLPSNWTADDEGYALNYFGDLCAVCGNPLNGLWHTASMDHWVSIATDVKDNPGTVPHNMVPLCHGENGCNNSKGAKLPDIWLTERYGKRKSNKIMKRIDAFFETVRQVE